MRFAALLNDDVRTARGPHPLGHILAHLVAAGPDRRADPRLEGRRLRRRGGGQLTHRRGQYATGQSSPAGMYRRYTISGGYQHRHAVGDEDRRRDARPIDDQGVAVTGAAAVASVNRVGAVSLRQPGRRHLRRGRNLASQQGEGFLRAQWGRAGRGAQEGRPDGPAFMNPQRPYRAFTIQGFDPSLL